MSESIANLKKEIVHSWGMNTQSESIVFRPTKQSEIQAIIQFAKKNQYSIAVRGGGCSYGDASLNQGGIVLDLTSFDKISDFDETTGILKAESGATIKEIWEYAIVRGYWPPVVSGTMYPTIGGAISMNIHGKNNYKVGPIGDHIVDFTLLTSDGKIIFCSKEKNPELFYSAISGFGMLGVIVEVSIKMKKIYSGNMKVWPFVVRNFRELFDTFEKEISNSDYLVGWVDAFATGESLGRGLIHKAVMLPEGEDKKFPDNCSLDKQNLPNRLFGIIPKSWMWFFMKPFANPSGMKWINALKYLSGSLSHNKMYFQGHAEFAFLLDYVPNWKFIYKPGSMIQYQSFLPKENAEAGFKEMFTLCQQRGIVTWLAVFKKHKPDDFLLSHGVDGYSMAMDFPVTPENKEKLWALCDEMDQIVLKNKGKFYFAKDSRLKPETVKQFLPKESLKQFSELKKKHDPGSLFETELYRRIKDAFKD